MEEKEVEGGVLGEKKRRGEEKLQDSTAWFVEGVDSSESLIVRSSEDVPMPIAEAEVVRSGEESFRRGVWFRQYWISASAVGSGKVQLPSGLWY